MLTCLSQEAVMNLQSDAGCSGVEGWSDWVALWFPRVAGPGCRLQAEVINQPLPCDSMCFGFLREWGRGSERKCFKGQFSQGPRRKLTGFLGCHMGSPRLPLPLHSTGQAKGIPNPATLQEEEQAAQPVKAGMVQAPRLGLSSAHTSLWNRIPALWHTSTWNNCLCDLHKWKLLTTAFS